MFLASRSDIFLFTQLVKEVEAELLLFSVTVDNEELKRFLTPPAGMAERRANVKIEILKIEKFATILKFKKKIRKKLKNAHAYLKPLNLLFSK